MDINKIMRMGSLFFTVVLSAFSAIKCISGDGKTAVYYFIAAAGFFIVYFSYRKKQQ